MALEVEVAVLQFGKGHLREASHFSAEGGIGKSQEDFFGRADYVQVVDYVFSEIVIYRRAVRKIDDADFP